MLNKGMSGADIRRRVNVSSGYISTLKKQMAHKVDEEKAEKLAEVKAAAAEEAKAKEVDTVLDTRADQYGSFMQGADIAIRIKALMHNVVARRHAVQLLVHRAALDMHHSHGVLLSGTVDAGVGLQIGFNTSCGCVPDDGVGCCQGQTMAGCLGLDEQDTRVGFGLEPIDDLTAPIDRNLAVDDIARDAFLLQAGTQKLDGMGERYEDQHLVACLLDDFQHHVQAVGHVELKHLTSIRIDRTSADLEQLVEFGRSVDRADLFAAGFEQQLVLKLGIIFALLRGEWRFALDVRNGR